MIMQNKDAVTSMDICETEITLCNNLLYTLDDEVYVDWGGSSWKAKIIQINSKQESPYKIHWVGCNKRWDTWISEDSIVEKC